MYVDDLEHTSTIPKWDMCLAWIKTKLPARSTESVILSADQDHVLSSKYFPDARKRVPVTGSVYLEMFPKYVSCGVCV